MIRNGFLTIAMMALAGCSSETPNCGDERVIELLQKAVDETRSSASILAPMEFVQQLTANFTSIRTLRHDSGLDSYVCESTLEVLYKGEVKQARMIQYEIYPVQGSESPVELRYDRAPIASTLSASAKQADAEEEHAKEQQAESVAKERRDAMLASLPQDDASALNHVEQMVAAALQSNVTIQVPTSGTQVIYSLAGSRQALSKGGPFFAGAYPDWNIICEPQNGQLECITARRDENWVHCVPGIGVNCDDASDGLIRTRLTASELRSILPYLSVNDTLGALEFGSCADGICYKQLKPIGMIQPQMQDWLNKRCGTQPTAECLQ